MTPRQRAALGDLDGLPADVRRVLESPGFRSLPAARPGDWLDAHPERGQSFDDFVASRANVPMHHRRTLVMLPIGDFGRSAVSPAMLRDFAEAFFALPVRLLAPATLAEVGATTRINATTGKRQLLTRDVLAFLRERLPDDAFSLSAFTLEDLYPEESWNFVFGQASLRDRVGVFSFARYDPAFFGEPISPGEAALLVRRATNVMAHETGHMFGLAHCVWFACLMNGSNSLDETDRRPSHVCPVCLRKLWWSIHFDPVARYRALERVQRGLGLIDEAVWTRHEITTS